MIGLGSFGMKRIETISQGPRARVVGVCDPNAAKTARVASNLGAKVQSFDEMLKDPAVDVIDIAVPNRYHAEYAIRSLQAGKTVWCEKPLAPSVEECRAIMDVAKDHNQFVKVGSNVRFFPSILRLKELTVSNIGTPLLFRGYIGNAGQQLAASSWYSKKEMIGGGTLLDNGIHLIDLVRWLLGEIVSCEADVSNRMWHLEGLEDLAVCMFQLSNGAKASIQASWHEWAGYLYLEIYGTDGFIRSDNRFSSAKVVVGNREGIVREYDYSQQSKMSYANELNDFLDCVEKSVEPTPSAYDGYRAVKVVRACYESARVGRAVSCLET
jgi:predicted dehydrogenase